MAEGLLRMGSRSDDHFEPPWFNLSPSFHARLNELAKELNLSREVILQRALRALERENEHRTAPMPSKLASKLSSHRWSKVPPHERSEMARELAKRRWNSK